MYFLNGDRIYIQPLDKRTPLDEQLLSCVTQAAKINEGREIYKLNFFADTPSEEAYKQCRRKIKNIIPAKFKNPVICTLISQPPVTSLILAEAFYYDTSLWQIDYFNKGKGNAIFFRRGDSEILTGNIQADSGLHCRKNAEEAFGCLREFLDQVKFPVNSIIRQWNYIENILGLDGEEQRYQEFNNARSVFYGNHFSENGYPAATGIGMDRGGVIIEFIALGKGESTTRPMNNPGQIAAHDYSSDVLSGSKCSVKSPPKFERARYLELFGRKLLFVSGTASIRGEKTVYPGNPAEQTRVTSENIRTLYSHDSLKDISGNVLKPKYGHARVYIKNRSDYRVIKNSFRNHFGDLPVVYLVADICRNDLLVEIEGKVILE